MFTYDRRGRGESGDTEPYGAEREVEDLEALINEVGMPVEAIAQMRNAPMWPLLEALAPTLVYDAAILGDNALPTERVATVNIPTLVMDGGASPAWMHNAAQRLAGALPNAQYRTLPGQTHDVAPEAIAPALVEFFSSSSYYEDEPVFH